MIREPNTSGAATPAYGGAVVEGIFSAYNDDSAWAMEEDLAEDVLSAYAGTILSPDNSIASSIRNEESKALPRYLDEAPGPLLPAPWRRPVADDDDNISQTSSMIRLEEEDRQLREEWDEGVRQLQTAFQIVLIPLVGKWFGRRWSYWCKYRRGLITCQCSQDGSKTLLSYISSLICYTLCSPPY